MSERRTPALTSPLVVTALGIGCYLGWQLVDISPTLFATPSAGVTALLDAWSMPATAVSSATLLILGLLSRRWSTEAVMAPLAIVVAAVTGLATALLYGAGWLAPQANELGVVAGRLLMAPSAVFVALWGELLCRVRFRDVLGCVSAGYATAFVICLLVACLEPQAAMLFRCTLPLISGMLALVASQDSRLLANVATSSRGTACTREPATARMSAKNERIPWNLLVSIGVFGAILTLANHLSETKTTTSTEIYTLAAGVAVSLTLLLATTVLRGRNADFTLLYRLVTPLVVAALLLTLCLQPGYQRYEALAIGAAWVFFRIFTWTMWTHVGARGSQSPMMVFAIGQVILFASSTLAEMLCRAVSPADMPLTLTASVIILVTVLTSALLMGESSLVRALGRADGAGGERDVETVDAETVSAKVREGKAAASMRRGVNPDERAEERAHDSAAAGKDEAQSAGGVSDAGGERSAGGAPGALPGMLADDATTGAATGGDAVERALGDAAANAVASGQRWGLSGREMQIALLVLTGASNARIAHAACITESTLRTHLRNIYAKAGVHSRDELIDAMTREDEDEATPGTLF